MEKYFLQNDTTGYLVKIFEVGFKGAPTEIFGKVSIDKGSVDNILDTIRGTALSLKLDASSDLTFDEFSDVEDEKKYTVKVTKGGQTVFNGFLKPDGITQSFVRNYWQINLDFIDGLGSLKDLAFVKSDGFNYTGKMSIYDVIFGCVARTGLVMTINSSIDIHYLGYAGTNILKDTYVSADRYFKIDAQTSGGGTTMTCEEVLNSILNLCSACITQHDGQWWVYRPNEFSNNVTFIDNTLNTNFVKNLYKKVGSQIDNYYPHHCNANQQIQTKGAISAYRLNYKYGFKTAINLNPTLKHDTSLIFENWTKTPNSGITLINDPSDTQGLIMMTKFVTPVDVLISQSYPVIQGSILELKADLRNTTVGTVGFFFKIKRSDGYYLNKYGEWQLGYIVDGVYGDFSATISGLGTSSFSFKSAYIDTACDVSVTICNAIHTGTETIHEVEVQTCELINNYNFDGRVGEFHTVTRAIAPSSIVKENQEVYNGDSIGDIFEGAIYKADKLTLTTLWTRTGKLEEKYLLQISAEDDMRISQKPSKTVTGDFYGYIPYLSIIEINNITGKFMFTEYSYNTDTNITSGKLQQFFTDEVPGIEYKLSYDYGNTVKPSIRS